ncbi:MAG: UDP-N-acetylglucosamine 2-epimerase (non-hydrolyzing) [Betaproteobacteria bacterium]
MRLLSIVGARPQFVKLAPLVRAIERHNASGKRHRIEHRILHTGQHYDAALSDVFFTDLRLPSADYHLGVGSGPHGTQTAAMLSGIERVLEQERPDLTLVYGDTNSTLAGTLAASKLHLLTAHVEAGLRSFNRRMPEEINRAVADHTCDLLLAPTCTAIANLEREGLASRAVLTGDLMHDVVLQYRAAADATRSVLARLTLERGAYGVVTLHRAENTDEPARLAALVNAFNDIAQHRLPLIFPLHPRTASRLRAVLPEWQPHARLRMIEPIGYLDSLTLLSHARVVLTDSGGLQKEALFVGCPCITLRAETEWVETLDADASLLADADPQRIRAAVDHWAARYPQGGADFSSAATEAFGGGDAAHRIMQAIGSFLARSSGAATSTATRCERKPDLMIEGEQERSTWRWLGWAAGAKTWRVTTTRCPIAG